MEEQNENMTVPVVDPLKIEVKVEVDDYNPYDYNPWSAEHSSAFLKYCCPECNYKNGTLTLFTDHALQNHENARILFADEISSDLNWFANNFAENKVETKKRKRDEKPNLVPFTKQEQQEHDYETNGGLLTEHDVYSVIETPEVKKSKKCLPLAEKLEIIQLYENGTTSTEIGKAKGMPESSVRQICKKKDKYKALFEQGSSSKNLLRPRSQIKLGMEELLSSWILDEEQKGTCIKNSQIQAKGQKLFLHVQNSLEDKTEDEIKETFKASGAWLKGFFQRKMPKKQEQVLNTVIMSCEICSTKMENETIFKSHILEKHMDGKQYCCPYCDTKYNRQRGLIFGLRGLIHHIDAKHPETGEKTFFCDKCKKGFIHKSSLDYHTSQNHLNRVCELCGIGYQSFSGLRLHMARNHTTGDEPVLMCDKCEFTATHKDLLKNHIRYKHNVDKHKNCPCCDFTTPTDQKLCIHIDVHHPEYEDKKFFCDKCGKSFIYELSLKQHVKFECKFSDYARNVKNLRRQTVKRIEVKCDYCFKTIINGQNIKLHYKRLHPDKPIILDGIDKFPCSHCKDFFFCKVSLDRHSHLEHGIETGKKYCQKCSKPYTIQHTCQKVYSYPCDRCDMKFKSKMNLESHVLSVHEKRLDFACDHCGKKWPTLHVLKGHIKGSHTQHVKCEICDKKISNPIELRRHKVFVHKQTEGAWLCEKCPKSAFFSKSTFEKHMKTKH